jgi:hypothetical protein
LAESGPQAPAAEAELEQVSTAGAPAAEEKTVNDVDLKIH